MDEISEILTFVGSAVWNVWPMFLISIILSVLIRTFKLDRLIRTAFSANIGKAIVLATVVGAFSPFCSCTVVPIIAGLLLSGVPLAPVMSFWIASPTMDPEIFTLSVGILGWPLALARLAATLAVSLAAGLITLALTRRMSLENILLNRRSGSESYATAASPTPSAPSVVLASAAIPPEPDVMPVAAAQTCAYEGVSDGEIAVCGTGQGAVVATPRAKQASGLAASLRAVNWSEFAVAVANESWLLGRWILLAFLMEALIIRYIPQTAIAGLLGDDNLFAVPLATLIGIPLYVNNYSALPIVSGLLAQGMQPGAAIAFLIAGPVTTIPAMTAVYAIVQRRVFALYLSISLFGAILMGVVSNAILG